MRAQLLKAVGGPENFELAEVPKPIVRPGTVLVRLAATSVNQIDVKIRSGQPIGPGLPEIQGSDVAGWVEEAGSGVMGFAPGDEVYAFAGGVKGQGGTLAEYIVVDVRSLAHKPRSLSMLEAAALPLVSITAWDGFERAHVSGTDHVLVHGGTGGVGHVAIQLAKALGARVATTIGSDDAAEIARSLGADETINYREEQVGAYVERLTAGRGFDLVYDTIGGKNLDASLAAVAVDGRLVTSNSRTTTDLGRMHAKALSFYVVFILLPLLRDIGRERHGRILSSLAALVDQGKVRPLLDEQRFTLATAPDAYRRLESGKARGKVVVDIAGTAA